MLSERVVLVMSSGTSGMACKMTTGEGKKASEHTATRQNEERSQTEQPDSSKSATAPINAHNSSRITALEA